MPSEHDDVPPMPFSLKIFLAVIGLLVAAFVIWHLAGGGFRHHGM